MSETVHYVGKLKLIEKLENESLNDVCKRILNLNAYNELEEWCDSWQEMLFDKLYKKYVIANNDVFEVLSLNDKGEEYEIFNVKGNKDGTYDYEVMYYNGGCGFDEAIEEAFDKLKE